MGKTSERGAFFVNIALVAAGKTRKRLKFVHFTTIIALVDVGNQGKEYRKIND